MMHPKQEIFSQSHCADLTKKSQKNHHQSVIQDGSINCQNSDSIEQGKTTDDSSVIHQCFNLIALVDLSDASQLGKHICGWCVDHGSCESAVSSFSPCRSVSPGELWLDVTAGVAVWSNGMWWICGWEMKMGFSVGAGWRSTVFTCTATGRKSLRPLDHMVVVCRSPQCIGDSQSRWNRLSRGSGVLHILASSDMNLCNHRGVCRDWQRQNSPHFPPGHKRKWPIVTNGNRAGSCTNVFQSSQIIWRTQQPFIKYV